MSTRVVFPLGPVTATTRASSPRRSRPSPTSEMIGMPRAPAARKTALRGLTPGLAMILSIPSSTWGVAPSTPDTWRAARVSRSRSSSPPSAARIALPLSVRARVAATPDSPSPYTRVLTSSPCRVVEEDVGEEEPHGGEGGLSDPESDHHLVLIPAQKLEVVVDGGHLEHPSSCELEDEDLDDNGEGFDDEQTAHNGQEELCLGEHSGRGQDAPYRERAGIAHKDVCRVGVVPEEPDDCADHGAADHGDVVLALEESDGRVGEQGYGRCTGREPVEAVRQVDGVGRARDHQQQEHAEERDPHHARPKDKAAVEVGHEHGLGDAHVTHGKHVGKNHRQGQKEELVAGAQPLWSLTGDLLPVVVEADARHDGDEQ